MRRRQLAASAESLRTVACLGRSAACGREHVGEYARLCRLWHRAAEAAGRARRSGANLRRRQGRFKERARVRVCARRADPSSDRCPPLCFCLKLLPPPARLARRARIVHGAGVWEAGPGPAARMPLSKEGGRGAGSPPPHRRARPNGNGLQGSQGERAARARAETGEGDFTVERGGSDCAARPCKGRGRESEPASRGRGGGEQGAGSVSISCGAAVPPTAATADAVYGPVRVAPASTLTVT